MSTPNDSVTSLSTANVSGTLPRPPWLDERFIQTLGLTEITLFGQDITGSAAFGIMGRRPEWFRAAIILEGFLWPVKKELRVYPVIQLVGSPFFRFLSTTFNFFLEYSLATLKKKGQQKFSAQETIAL